MGLDTVEYLLDIEEEFSIKITDEDAEKLGVISDMVQHVIRVSNEVNGINLQENEVFDRIANILETRYSIKRHFILRSSHVVTDLGLE